MEATNRVGFRSQDRSVIASPMSEFQIIDTEVEIWRAQIVPEIASWHTAAETLCPRR
jgi:hypothetical protein